ncbi:MAG: T9SS type A sorting domain-containing protein, partial [Polaribacter sp.]
DYESMIVPVGVKADAGKEITFSAEVLNLPAGLNVYLEDKEANIFTRLDEANAQYTVTVSEALNGIGRFYLHTSSQVLGVANVDLVSVSIYSANQKIHLSGLPNGVTTITLYDVLGKVILKEETTENATSISAENVLKGSIYLVNLKTEKGIISKKIIIQ